MSSAPERDSAGDISADREEQPLFPAAPREMADRRPFFYTGILIGLAGGALAGVAPWLAGLLIAAGYGMTAFALIAPRHRFLRALRFGFVLSALLGAVIFAGELLAPDTALKMAGVVAGHSFVFAGVALMPLAIGIVRYVYGLLRPVTA